MEVARNIVIGLSVFGIAYYFLIYKKDKAFYSSADGNGHNCMTKIDCKNLINSVL